MKILIDNWRDGWRLWSVRCQALGLALLGLIEMFPDIVYRAWAALPPAMQSHVHEDVVRWVAYATLIAAIVARFIRQRKLHERRESNERIEGADKKPD